MSPLNKSNRRGLTLIEIMIALAMTLIVLGAMMYAFRYASGEISRGRALMELSNQLRVAQDLLRKDFDGVTVDLRPWAQTSGPNGYFEIMEGFGSDTTGNGLVDTMLGSNDKARIDADGNQIVDAQPVEAVMGDTNDMIAMTVRSESRPFRGRFNGTIIESNVAEIIWWTSYVDDNTNGIADFGETITLHRRVLLIRPDLLTMLTHGTAPLTVATPTDIQEFFLINDISARVADVDSNGTFESMIPNSLADLSKRENRFGRFGYATGGGYPFAMQTGLLGTFQMSAGNMDAVDAINGTYAAFPSLRTKAGDDAVIADIVGFDVQVFSPDTPIEIVGGVTLEPDDFGYTGLPVNAVQSGAFVDLGYGHSANLAAGFAAVPYDSTLPAFSTLPTPKSGLGYVLPTGTAFVVWDSFSTHYESNGIDDDVNGFIDEAVDGIDNDAANGVDDNLERETTPPYPDRLLGVKVTLRIVERNSGQVRQTEVISSFVPQ